MNWNIEAVVFPATTPQATAAFHFGSTLCIAAHRLIEDHAWKYVLKVCQGWESKPPYRIRLRVFDRKGKVVRVVIGNKEHAEAYLKELAY